MDLFFIKIMVIHLFRLFYYLMIAYCTASFVLNMLKLFFFSPMLCLGLAHYTEPWVRMSSEQVKFNAFSAIYAIITLVFLDQNIFLFLQVWYNVVSHIPDVHLQLKYMLAGFVFAINYGKAVKVLGDLNLWTIYSFITDLFM